jgi:hypothetical protein
VPNLWALNFLLHESLGGGGTVSLRLDAQGKTLSHALLAMEVRAPGAVGRRGARGDAADGHPARAESRATPRSDAAAARSTRAKRPQSLISHHIPRPTRCRAAAATSVAARRSV